MEGLVRCAAEALALDWAGFLAIDGKASFLVGTGTLSGIGGAILGVGCWPLVEDALRCDATVFDPNAVASGSVPASIAAGCPGLRSAVASPVRTTQRLRGALVGLCRGERLFAPREVRILEVLARQAALALERAGMVEALADNKRELATLRSDAALWSAKGAAPPPAAEPTPLTPREREVIRLVAEGLASKEIAARLRVKPKTVEGHRSAIMDKLSIRTIAGLVKYAILHNLASLHE